MECALCQTVTPFRHALELAKDKNPTSDINLYSSPEGSIRVEVVYSGDTFWLTQKRMAELFGVEVPAVSRHLKNIFETAELQQHAVISKMETTASDGKSYLTTYYNLDAIIAVGYRVNSRQATQFRIWATNALREFIIKGFVLDDERLKQGKRFGKDYFDELLERIREIRASERRFYQKICSGSAPRLNHAANNNLTNISSLCAGQGLESIDGSCPAWCMVYAK
jgi:hypothetical protein